MYKKTVIKQKLWTALSEFEFYNCPVVSLLFELRKKKAVFRNLLSGHQRFSF